MAREGTGLVQDPAPRHGNDSPFLDWMIPMAQGVLALPDDKPAKVSNNVELTFYVLANMASHVVGPGVGQLVNYMPVPDELPELGEALAWASTGSVRLENERVAEIKHQRGEAV